MVDLEAVRDSLVKVALEAGNLIREKTGKVEFDDKKNAIDLVTEIDKAVEALVSSSLRDQFPDYEFMGEESYVPGQTVLTDAPTFIVDPIDGTTNFVHGFPFSCISLGFAIDKRPAVGVVHNPSTGDMYTAIKGKGAYLVKGATVHHQGKPEPVKLPIVKPQKLTLKGSLIAVEWGVDRAGNNFQVKTDTFKSLAAEEGDGGAFVQGFRSMGSAALNICNVAAGLVDSYWEGGCYAWDVCAGWIILEEAGGRMVSGNAGEWDPAVDSRVYFAVRGGESSDQYIKDFWSHIKGTLEY
uniref:Inositol-1-monophosphatase n=1 Tax=Blastobotrys adeninivorans TaxID=409370 RepID=A0A060SYN8_BLAAD